MFEEQYKESYEVLSAALSLHKAFELAKADEKFDLSDLAHMVEPMVKLPSAVMDAEKALQELKLMAPDARGEMLKKLSLEYDILDDVLEAKVEAGIECLVAIGKFVGVLVPQPEPVPAA